MVQGKITHWLNPCPFVFQGRLSSPSDHLRFRKAREGTCVCPQGRKQHLLSTVLTIFQIKSASFFSGWVGSTLLCIVGEGYHQMLWVKYQTCLVCLLGYGSLDNFPKAGAPRTSSACSDPRKLDVSRRSRSSSTTMKIHFEGNFDAETSLQSDVEEMKEELATLRQILVAEADQARELREEVSCLTLPAFLPGV